MASGDGTARLDVAELWDYSLRCWRLPAVREACIALQDRHGFSVNELLLAVFAGYRGLDMGGQWASLSASTALDRNVLHPLRRARRGAAELLGRDAPLYRQLQALELDAEQAQQAALCDELQLDGCRAEGGIQLARANLDELLAVRLGVDPAPAAARALQALLRAVPAPD